MKVKLLCSRAGNGFSQAYGSVVEMEDAEAERHIHTGLAEAVEPPDPDQEKKPHGKPTKTDK